MCSELFALYGLLPRRGDQVRDVQPCKVRLTEFLDMRVAADRESSRDRCLGIENKKGTLRPGADADLVVLDRKGNVLSTWVKGKEAWRKGN